MSNVTNVVKNYKNNQQYATFARTTYVGIVVE